MTDFLQFPKVEIHRHLEGSVRPSTILEIARAHDLPLPSDDLDGLKRAVYVREPADSIADVFARFRLAQQSFVSPETIARITREAVEDAAADNVVLLELRFSPSFMTDIHDIPWDEVLDAVSAGVGEAQANRRIEVGLIVICSRDLGVDRCDETLEFCLRHRDRIVGVDLAGDETHWPARLFRSTFRRAREAGLPITIHAGEVAGPTEVEDALTLLYADRIGHGVRIVESPALLKNIVEERVPLELCPTSNYVTRSTPTLASHPLLRFLKAGAIATLSSDDPEIFGISLTHELEISIAKLGLDIDDIRTCTRNALVSSFLPESARQRAGTRCEEYLRPE